MKYPRYLLMLLVVILPVEGARYADPVKLVQEGLDDYERKGVKRALITWGIDSLHVIGEALMKSEKKLGKVENYDIPDRVDVSTKAVVVYCVVNYENGPLFIEFYLYNSIDGWIVLDINALSMDAYLEKRTVLENSRNLDEMILLRKSINSLLNEQSKTTASLNASLILFAYNATASPGLSKINLRAFPAQNRETSEGFNFLRFSFSAILTTSSAMPTLLFHMAIPGGTANMPGA